MRPLTALEMLGVWEAGQGRSLADRALLLLASACPESSWDTLAALPIGRRDATLLTLREWTFGSAVSSLVHCPACGDRLEVSFGIDDLRAPARSEPMLSLRAHGYEIDVRLPTSVDLIDVEGMPDARRQLLRRCVRGARRRGRRRPFSQLPARVLDAVDRGLSEADSQASVRAELSCPTCAHRWQALFDIVSFFWEELGHWVRRTLRDVHVLASAYGWSEADVLALSPWRRQYYLQLVQR